MKNFTYDPVFKYLCVQNCIFHILNILGCENSKHVMRCPIDFRAKKILFSEDKGIYKIFFQKPGAMDCVLPFVDLKTFSSEDTEGVWNENKFMLKNGMPIIALVDVYFLRYRKEYGNLHGSHSIILVDYYADTDSVKIVDWYEPYFFIGLVQSSDFMKARGSKNPKCANPYSGIPITNEWLYVFPKKYEILKDACLLENLLLSLNGISSTEDIYGIDSIGHILRFTELDASKEYFRELHENLFPVWRLFELLFSNIYDVISGDADMQINLESLMEYKNKFQELLFLILKLSIKTNENSYRQLLINMYAFYRNTKKLYVVLQEIYNFLLMNSQGEMNHD